MKNRKGWETFVKSYGGEPKSMLRRGLSAILMLVLVLTIVACQSQSSPKEFAPSGEIVKKAIAFQFERAQQQLSKQLKTDPSTFDISQINVKQLDPILVADLPTYHLQGTYQLKLNLRRQSVIQRQNPFDVYLQRQIEGETWRLLIKNPNLSSQSAPWASYLIE
jgi:hypothetical protein